jgi:hypothetical protein
MRRLFAFLGGFMSEFLSDAMESIAGAPNTAAGVSAVVEWVKSAVVQYGCPKKDAIVAAADKAIDAVLAINVPQIPDIVEAFIDKSLAVWAKKQVRVLIDKACPVVPDNTVV